MTTKAILDIPYLQIDEVLRLAADSYAGLLFSTRHFIRSRWGNEAIRLYDEAVAHDYALCLKGRGITSPIDFVRTLAIHAVNVYGSQVEIEGDDTHATFECKSCGVCWAAKDMRDVAKKQGRDIWTGVEPLKHFELISKDLGLDFTGEVVGDGFRFTVSRPVETGEGYQSLD